MLVTQQKAGSTGRRFAVEFRVFSLTLVESFSFNGVILTVIAFDALLIGIQASGYVAMKSGIIISNQLHTILGYKWQY